MFANVYQGKRVLVTGHTGFKGSWLTAWLLELGAEVTGFAIDVPTEPSNFSVLGLQARIDHRIGDVRELSALQTIFDEFKPQIVFHLAAQSLVRRSYQDPHATFSTNAVGTLNILECLRQAPGVEAAVIITSDKAYRNLEWQWGYRENDVLGGDDPYSASKGCAELISHSYIKSFLGAVDMPNVATTRAGNVIGGGDWAEDRIVPDCMRAWSEKNTLTIRNPAATRPWQHVLEPVSGYLWLGAQLCVKNKKVCGEAFNFGPDALTNHSVETLIQCLAKDWPGAKWHSETTGDQHPEAGLLKLSCDKALANLNWHAVLNFDETVAFTSDWYQYFYNKTKSEMYPFAQQQIRDYSSLAEQRGLAWT